MAGTPGACSQVFCHPIRCKRWYVWTNTHISSITSAPQPPQPPHAPGQTRRALNPLYHTHNTQQYTATPKHKTHIPTHTLSTHPTHTLNTHTHNHFNTHAQHTTHTHTHTHAHTHMNAWIALNRQPTVILRRKSQCLDMCTDAPQTMILHSVEICNL